MNEIINDTFDNDANLIEEMEHEEDSYFAENSDVIGFEFDEENERNEALKQGFEQMGRMSSDWTVATILDQIARKKINLDPKFQRRDAWNSKKKSQFIESLILDVPIPDILMGQDIENKNLFHVIDGKQRLLSILQFFSGKISKNISDDEIKGYRLRGLEILPELNGLSKKNLEKKYPELIDKIENAPIRTVVLKNITNQGILYEVFRRLNTGSQSLSTQELRQSIYPGPFVDFIDDLSATPNIIRELMKITRKDNRMRDNELFVRYFAIKFRKNKYDNSISKFLDEATSYFNKEWDSIQVSIKNALNEMIEAIRFVEKYFKDDSFRLIGLHRQNLPFNRVLFELMTYYFSQKEIRNKIETKKIDLKREYLKLIEQDDVFIQSITENTHQTTVFKYRFDRFGEFLNTL